MSLIKINSSQEDSNQPPSFFRRLLPDSCVAFDSDAGILLFRESLLNDTMKCYFKLANVFQTQHEPAYCGLATLAMVLNSLDIDPQRQWKGVWRWFDEDLLDCCVPLARVQTTGVTMDELSCIAICNGVVCETVRPVESLWISSAENNLDIDNNANDPFNEWADSFRIAVRKAVNSTNSHRLIVSYDRSVLGQTGTGHFSPIAAYHEPSDKVLIMDVARFKYPPHWVSLRLLAKAMLSKDSSTNKSRGYQVISPDTRVAILPAARITQWRQTRDILLKLIEETFDKQSSSNNVVATLNDAIVEASTLASVRQSLDDYKQVISVVSQAPSCCAIAKECEHVINTLSCSSSNQCVVADSPVSHAICCAPPTTSQSECQTIKPAQKLLRQLRATPFFEQLVDAKPALKQDAEIASFLYLCLLALKEPLISLLQRKNLQLQPLTQLIQSEPCPSKSPIHQEVHRLQKFLSAVDERMSTICYQT